MTTLNDLRAIAGEGYNLAMVKDENYEQTDLADFEMDAVPVLAEAKGPLGVMRAMETRRPGSLKAYAHEGKKLRLLHLVFFDEGWAVLNIFDFVVTE